MLKKKMMYDAHLLELINKNMSYARSNSSEAPSSLQSFDCNVTLLNGTSMKKILDSYAECFAT